MKLSIIIVNYNVKYFLEQCLCSVVRACKNIEAEIFVVDNNSTDGSKNFFSGRFPQVHFIWKNENTGFAKANNEALKLATGEKILFLNPDTLVPEDCFEKCLTFFSTEKNIGAIGPHMIDGSGKYLPESKRGFPSVSTSFFKMIGFAKIFPHSKIFAKYYLGHLPEDKINEVDVLAGAFMMIDKKVLDVTGGFDEDFFMYGEDIDLSYRIQKSGYRNYYFPETSVIHFKGESTQKNNLQYVKKFYGAMGLFVKKHYKSRNAIIYNFIIPAAIWLKAALSGITKKLKNVFSVKKIKHDNQPALVVACKEDFSILASLINQSEPGQIIIGRVSPGKFSEPGSLGSIEQLGTLVKEHNEAAEIIFCQNEFSFKETIRVIQELPGGITYKFHAAGTMGIISSTSKNSAGDYISFENKAPA